MAIRLIAVLLLLSPGLSLALGPAESGTVDGNVRVAINERDEVVVMVDDPTEGDPDSVEYVFCFTPVDSDTDAFDRQEEDVRVTYLQDRLTVMTLTNPQITLVDVALGTQETSAIWVAYSVGIALEIDIETYFGDLEDEDPDDFSGEKGLGEGDDCSAGGPGSSSCNKTCPGTQSSCGVTCNSGYYSCCGCTIVGSSYCYCVKEVG
jgi:hypothetical protein